MAWLAEKVTAEMFREMMDRMESDGSSDPSHLRSSGSQGQENVGPAPGAVLGAVLGTALGAALG